MRLVLLLLLLSGCFGHGPTEPSGPSNEAPAAHHVVAQNFSFEPTDLSISAGEAVSWLNRDEVVHHITSENSSFDSGRWPPEARFTWSFDQPGQYPYRCAIHPGMVGSIRVESS